MITKIHLPCLRGKMGDWFYYITLMSFKQLALRSSMVPDIHNNIELSRWIQREVGDRIDDIVDYLQNQPQRFFNSIICGIYGGKPVWQELDIDKSVEFLNEEEKDYLERTFGILTLSGQEVIFAIDGQHRTKAIKEVVKVNKDLMDEEVSVIFLAHKTDKKGEERTRRLFSTLNRYAAPVTISEIIALDEEDNAAILTRRLMEDFELLKPKILFSKTRSISINNSEHFSNIVILYDIVCILLTDKTFSNNYPLEGHNFKKFTSKRMSESELNQDYEHLKDFLETTIKGIPSLESFFYKNTALNRQKSSTSLLFRPIGQLILFYVLTAAKQNEKFIQALNFFAKDDFNLSNPTWKKVFVDLETNTLKTDKARQILATQLILLKLKMPVQMTKKEKTLFDNFNIDTDNL